MQQQARGSVAIGGLGGSGTRVFAELLRHAGYAFCPSLSHALDDLWFTVLFKRAEWAGRLPPAEGRAEAAALYLRARTLGLDGQLKEEDQALLARLRADLLPQGTWKSGATQKAADALTHSKSAAGLRWGWKEPNTHIFLPDLDAAIPGLRYIHIVRDPLDMAFSANNTQVRLWGRFLGVSKGDETPSPSRQLRFWTAANQRALSYGRSKMPGRFLLIRYEAFCADPQAHWERIVPFIEAPADLDLPEGLVRPTTIGRGATHDLSIFDPDDLEAARALESELEKSDALA